MQMVCHCRCGEERGEWGQARGWRPFGIHWSLVNESRLHLLHCLLLRVLTVRWGMGLEGKGGFFFKLLFLFLFCEAEGRESREHIHKSGIILSPAWSLFKRHHQKQQQQQKTAPLLMHLCDVPSTSFPICRNTACFFFREMKVVPVLERELDYRESVFNLFFYFFIFLHNAEFCCLRWWKKCLNFCSVKIR